MILKSDYLQFSTLYKSDSRISTAKTHVGTIRVKHFRARITMLFSTFKKKSDITIFAWRVTLNYASISLIFLDNYLLSNQKIAKILPEPSYLL